MTDQERLNAAEEARDRYRALSEHLQQQVMLLHIELDMERERVEKRDARITDLRYGLRSIISQLRMLAVDAEKPLSIRDPK